MPQIRSTIIVSENIFELTLSPLSVESCCQTSKSKLSKVSSNIRSPEQTFFSFDAFFRPLIVAVVTVFSHLMLAPRTPPRASTTKNRLKNIFTIFSTCRSCLSLLMLLICLMDRVELYDVRSSLSVFIQFH